MRRILKYVIIDIVKNKIVVFYTVLIALFAWSAFGLEDNASKGLLTLLNIILFVVPLFSVLFSTIYPSKEIKSGIVYSQACRLVCPFPF